jgi:colanic acid biosynthesis glycosyl transferase WcaI
MKLLFLSNYFPPEVGSGPHLPFELAESLVEAGHEVTVVTGFPRYNVPEMPQRYRWRLLAHEETSGVKVVRINAPNFYGRSVFSRGMVQLLAPPVLAVPAMFRGKPDLVYTVSPPLMMGIVAHLVAKRFRVPCVVNVQDLFPQTLIDLGILRSQRMIHGFEAMERYVYRKATAITVMSDGNGGFISGRGADASKVHTVFNWVDTDAIRPEPRLSGFRREHNIGDEFVVLFAGTMGWSQALDVVIDAAGYLVHESGILFLLVGGGAEQERIKKRAETASNVRFLPMQPKDLYPQLLAAADVGLVTLRPEVATPSVPSKIATIMAAGRPVVASLPGGDASKLVQDAGCGLVTAPGDGRKLADAIIRLKNDPEMARRMGANGRTYAESHLSRSSCVKRNEEVFRSVVEKYK